MFPQFPQTSHFPAYFHSSARKAREKSRRRGPQDGVQRVPGWLRRRWASLEEASGKPRRGWGLRPSSELIGTALLFYPPTKACSFRKAYYPPAEQLLQSRFTAAAERSQHHSFFGLTHFSRSNLHTGIIPDSVHARFVKFKTASLSKFYFHVFFCSHFIFLYLFFSCFSGMRSPNVHILIWRMS